MSIGALGLITVLMVLAGTAASISLAFIGFGFMSFAWARVASAIVGAFLCFLFRSDRSIYWMSLREWRSVVAFGPHDSATAVLTRIAEYAPYLIWAAPRVRRRSVSPSGRQCCLCFPIVSYSQALPP